METLEKLDHALLLVINGWNTPFFDQLMWVLSTKLIMIAMIVISIVLSLQFLPKKNVLIFTSVIILTFTTADFLSVHVFKNQVKRNRPTHHLEISKKLHLHVDENGEFYRGGTYGFVSSHATNYFCVATFILLFFWHKYRKTALVFMFFAALVSYSRIYLGVHYPSDVFVGALFGILMASIGFLVSKNYIFSRV